MSVEVKNLKAVVDRLGEIAGRSAPYAMAAALTSTAWSVQKDAAGKMAAPKPTTVRQIRVEKATAAKTVARVYMDDAGAWKAETLLGHLFRGGRSHPTRAEGQLFRKGILNVGNLSDILPAKGGKMPTGAGMVKILSAVQAFGEQGYRANMSPAKLVKMARVGKTKGGYKTIRGSAMFVSFGGQNRVGGRSWAGGRNNRQLAPGIWKKSGTHGSNVEPVLLFGRTPRYRQIINLEALAKARLPEFTDEFYSQLSKMLNRKAFGG